jgi:hypothetical protein
MGKVKVSTGGLAGKLVDELRLQEVELCRAQARRAELMVEFSGVRRELDQARIADRRAVGVDARFKAGEFAALEISLALMTSKYVAQRILAMTRRVQAECPDAWDAWLAGEIDQDKVVRINRALRRLVHASSKQLLNATVIEVAVHQTPELLGRWLNQFIARVEPEEQNERLRRSMEDRYASVRPDIDGMSFLSALMSAVDAAAIDRILSALAAAAPPGDTRSMAQRRSDALVDMLCGRISNGCHVRWDTNDDADDDLDDPVADDQLDHPMPDGLDFTQSAESDSGDPGDDHISGADPAVDTDGRGPAAGGNVECPAAHEKVDGRGTATGGEADSQSGRDMYDDESNPEDGADSDGADSDGSDSDEASSDEASTEEAAGLDEDWAERDWGLPASAFRPDPHAHADEPQADLPPELSGEFPIDTTGVAPRTAGGTWRITPCPENHQPNPLPVSIGVVVSAQSLFGYSNTPGQLMDRSALVPAEVIRELAKQQDTLFYRLLTDEKGNLLDVTEMGRFPSRKLGMAVKLRAGVCQGPTCHVAATRCDLDHLVPVPEGPTAAVNLGPECRGEHRAKTHAGHQVARTGPHTTQWVTPTGHVYTAEDPQLPVEEWPTP